MNRAEKDCLDALKAENARLRERLRLAEACAFQLNVVLPMARAYAVSHRVGRNAEMIAGAVAALAAFDASRKP